MEIDLLDSQTVLQYFKPNHILYIRFLVSNFKRIEIREFLEISRKEEKSLRLKIEYIMKTDDWYIIIDQLFRMKVLKKADYIDDETLTRTNFYVEKLFKSCFVNKECCNSELIKRYLEEYLSKKTNKLFLSKKDKMLLSYIFKYKKSSNSELGQVIGIHSKKMDEYKLRLFKKLDCGCWFSAVKMVLKLDFLQIDIDHQVTLLEKLNTRISKAQNCLALITIEHFQDVDYLKFAIYNELIALHLYYKFDILLGIENAD